MCRPGSSRPRMRIQQMLVSLLAFTAFIGANGGSTARDLAKSKDVGIFARSQYRQPFGLSYFSRQLQASNLDDLPAWRGRIDPQYKRSFMAPAITQNKCRGNQDCSTSLGRYPYEDYIIDPTGNSAQPVVKVGYPKGAWTPGSRRPGGTLFFLYPYKRSPQDTANSMSVETASLEYEVYFPNDFDWVKGGKLPGLAGGDRNGRGCGGGVNPEACFSYRVMWRRNGYGEAYIYAPQRDQSNDFCKANPKCTNSGPYPCNLCNFRAGVSWGRGAFRFKRGEWNKLKITLSLNKVGAQNGFLGLEFNGKTVISYNKMVWRKKNDIYIEGIDFSTWFGGSTSDWAPRSDTYALFRNMKAYRSGPSTRGGGNSRATSSELAGQFAQVMEEEVIEAGE